MFLFAITYILFGGGKRTRTSEPEGADLQSAAIAAMRYPHLEQVVRIELTSPVWKTRALTAVLYLLLWTSLESNQVPTDYESVALTE